MTTVRALRGGAGASRADLVAIPVVEGGAQIALRTLDRRIARVLGRRARAMEFRGRPDEMLVHPTERSVVVLAGLGPAPGPAAWRRIGARLRREAERQGAREVSIDLGAAGGAGDTRAAVAEGFLLAGYRFDRYKSQPNGRRPVARLTLLGEAMGPPAEVRPGLEAVEAVVGQVFRVRDLVNEPASAMTPRVLAEQAKAVAKSIPGLAVDVWQPARIEKEGLAGLAAVARGSREEPRFLVLHWRGPGARRHIALVGKAITFDSGGLSLKPAKSMETMKYDMAGGAAVIGALAAAAALRLPIEVTGYVSATENLPGGRAQKPGDVLRYLNGKTVEVLNTDAEGRLVLADALVLASRAKPDAIVDLATLTGGARVALGALYACVLGNDQPLVDGLLAAGQTSGELLWQLPLVAEYRDDIKSGVADLKNVSAGGEAGTIVGALFLQEFVDGVPWAHLDIAGPAFAEKEQVLAPRGGTGFGVRLLVRWLRDLAAPEA